MRKWQIQQYRSYLLPHDLFPKIFPQVFHPFLLLTVLYSYCNIFLKRNLAHKGFLWFISLSKTRRCPCPSPWNSKLFHQTMSYHLSVLIHKKLLWNKYQKLSEVDCSAPIFINNWSENFELLFGWVVSKWP